MTTAVTTAATTAESVPAPTSRRPPRVPVPPPEGAELLTRENVAWMLQCSVKCVSDLVAQEAIPTVPVPGTGRRRCSRLLRFSRTAVLDWIRQGCPRP